MKLEPGSPSKVLSRRHKSSLAPTPKAVASAQDLLKKLSRTNKPESLACAVPSYPDDPSLGLNNRAEEEDSYIAKQALRLQNARCCWEILKEGFIQRSGSDMMSSPRKPTSRRSTRGHYDGDDGWEDEDNDTPAPVGDHAWSVLDWLLALFEKDEAAVERAGQGEAANSVALWRSRSTNPASSPILAPASQSDPSIARAQHTALGRRDAA